MRDRFALLRCVTRGFLSNELPFRRSVTHLSEYEQTHGEMGVAVVENDGKGSAEGK